MKDNVLHSIGESILISVFPKISGKIHFTDFQDSLTGITSDRSVSRFFRISSDEIFWSEWKELTNENLAETELTAEFNLCIEIRYTRTGTDDTGDIEFNNIEFHGSIEKIEYVSPTLNSSIFSNIIGSELLRKIENNLFKKLYFRGILPQYITRAENFDKDEDKGFIDLFFPIARFFSMFICLFKRWENFKNDYDLMLENVKEYGFFIDESNITIDELQFLSSHYLDEIRKRGTVLIFKRKGDVLPSGYVQPIDGEFLRLMKNNPWDEFIYENTPLSKVGWCMGESSPIYRGTMNSVNLNKTKENSKDFQSLSNFITSGSGTNSVSVYQAGDKGVLLLTASGGGECGIGRVNDSVSFNKDLLVVVDSSIDYEITFMFLTSSTGASTNKIRFGVEGFSKLGDKLNDCFIVPNGTMVSEIFFEEKLQEFKPNTWYQARGIIHAYSSINTENYPTNLGYGNNLHFNNKFCRFISPKIQLVTTSGSSTIEIWDYKIRPLVRGKHILPLKEGEENSTSLGFIQSSNLFYSYVKNNNQNQSEREIVEAYEKYLFPFDSTDIIVLI